MPTDVRKLIFSRQEMCQSFQTFCQSKGFSPKGARVEGFEVLDGERPQPGRIVAKTVSVDGMRAIITFTSRDPQNPERVHLDQDQIMEAMITTCREDKIPLPRRGQKYLQKHKDSLALAIGMAG